MLHKNKSPSRKFPEISRFPRNLQSWTVFCRGDFFVFAFFLDRLFVRRMMPLWFRGFFSFTGNILENCHWPRICVRGKLLLSWNFLEPQNPCRGKLPPGRNILDKKWRFEDKCKIQEISSTQVASVDGAVWRSALGVVKKIGLNPKICPNLSYLLSSVRCVQRFCETVLKNCHCTSPGGEFVTICRWLLRMV